MFTQFKRLIWKASLLTTIISLLAFTVALAASGDLDTTFDGDGLVTTYVVPTNPGRYDLIRGTTVQSDGKIVAAGSSFEYSNSGGNYDFAITRYNTDGSLDSTFHTDGRRLTNFGGSDVAFDVAVQSNGKVVVSGRVCGVPMTIGYCDVAVARYLPSGALDTTFSGDGKQTTNFGSDNGSFGGLAIQSDGKIVVAGYRLNGTHQDFAVYRYNIDGSLDTTFSGDGMISIGFGAGRHDDARDLVIQNDGKIVVAGTTNIYTSNGVNLDFALARLNTNGTLDTTFSGDGKQITDFDAEENAYSLAIQPNGKIVVVGDKCASGCSLAVVRYNMDGNLDTTFNGTGKKVFRIISGFSSGARDVIVQMDGKIVVLGTTSTNQYDDMALVRLKTGGGFDTTFSGDGKLTVDFGVWDEAWALALQPLDGKYVLAGSTYDGTQFDFALARVLPQ